MLIMFISIVSSVFSKSEFYSATEPKWDMEKKIYIKYIICSIFPPRLNFIYVVLF